MSLPTSTEKHMPTRQPVDRGFVLWLTGLSGAGKSTVADALYDQLTPTTSHLERLDGDIVREHLTKDLWFSPADRATNIERVTFVAKLLSRNDIGVIATFISPYQQIRARIRQQVTNFIEVYVNAPLAVCEQRDVKGLYQQARAGKIEQFTGISDPYEPPRSPEIELRTDQQTVQESVDQIKARLIEHEYISQPSAL